jgi:hypothetical protein
MRLCLHRRRDLSRNFRFGSLILTRRLHKTAPCRKDCGPLRSTSCLVRRRGSGEIYKNPRSSRPMGVMGPGEPFPTICRSQRFEPRSEAFDDAFAVLVKEFVIACQRHRAFPNPRSSNMLKDAPTSLCAATSSSSLHERPTSRSTGSRPGEGEMRPAGLLQGVAFADVVMVELRDLHAALSMEEIRA